MNQKTYSKTDILGKPQSYKDAVEMLKKFPETYQKFQMFPKKHQTTLLEFFTGESSLDIQMDPFFKKIMDPQIHPERLESLISSVLGEEIKIDHILPNEGIRLNDKGSQHEKNLSLYYYGEKHIGISFFPSVHSYKANFLFQWNIASGDGKNHLYHH